MRGHVFIYIVAIFGCSSSREDKIVVPELHAGFYNEALERINDKLESDPANDRLVNQKLFYCEQLGWPTTCISALDAYKQIHGMSNQLVEHYITYYQRHYRYQLLIEMIEKWDLEFDLIEKYTESYIDALVRTGRNKRAILELRTYLKEKQDIEAVEFASRQFLSLGDTAMAAYNLGKLYQIDPENNLMWYYGNILVSLGYEDLGFEVMDGYVKRHLDDIDVQVTYARLLDLANRNKQARHVLKPFAQMDTVAYILAEWYDKDQMWDSARVVLEEMVERDSSDRKPVWKLGRLYEEHGWFTSSMACFEYLLEMNPNDTLAQQRIDLIQRKIAYLQRLKFEESKIPTIELQPKKIEN